MTTFRSDVPSNIAITREASVEVIDTSLYLNSQAVVDRIKADAATVGGAARIDLPKLIIPNAKSLAIWKATRQDSSEWQEFVDFLQMNKIRPAVITQMKRIVEDHFIPILENAIAEQKARVLSSTREILVDRYLGSTAEFDHTNTIKYTGGYREELQTLKQRVEAEEIADDELVTVLDSIIHDRGGVKTLHVQKFLGVIKDGNVYKIQYIPLMGQV